MQRMHFCYSYILISLEARMFRRLGPSTGWPRPCITTAGNCVNLGNKWIFASSVAPTMRLNETKRKWKQQVQTMKLTPEEMRQHLIRVTLKPISFSPSYDKRSAKPVNPNIKQTLNPILLGSNVKFFFRIGGKSACMQKFTKFFIWHQILIKTGKMSSYHFYHSLYSTYSINYHQPSRPK